MHLFARRAPLAPSAVSEKQQKAWRRHSRPSSVLLLSSVASCRTASSDHDQAVGMPAAWNGEMESFDFCALSLHLTSAGCSVARILIHSYLQDTHLARCAADQALGGIAEKARRRRDWIQPCQSTQRSQLQRIGKRSFMPQKHYQRLTWTAMKIPVMTGEPDRLTRLSEMSTCTLAMANLRHSTFRLHVQRVRSVATSLARTLQSSGKKVDLQVVELAALFHDLYAPCVALYTSSPLKS